MVESCFVIKPYHWWLTIGVAMLVHVMLLINYKQESAQLDEPIESANYNEVIIGLKKLKTPQPIEKQNVVEIPVVDSTPIKPKPLIRKPKVIKPKPVKKPKPKVVVTPKITTPQVSPIMIAKDQKETKNISSNKSTAKPNSAIRNIGSTALKNKKASYYATLAKWLEKHKKYPTIARRRNQQGEVTIKFTLNRRGELLRFKLIKSSEHHSLNTAAIKMLKRASPMPIPPQEIIGSGGELEFTIPVNFNLLVK
ncbi:MAG: energy transducer TonB [Gammaproteobacteria bacterium]